MPENDDKSTAVVFLCGDASNGKITLCDSSLFDKVIHEVASDGDNLIALCEEGCYNLSTNGIAANCNFKATNFCFGTKTNYVLTSKQPIVYSWGEGPYGELGLGFCKTKVEEPVPIKHKASFTSISSGEYHCAALDTVGNAYSWGQNFDRQLGLYRNDSSKFKSPNCVVEEVMFVPSLLPFSLLCPIRKISCGARFTVAIGRNGDLWSWGAGECGQLGTGRCTRREAPAKVEILVDTAYCLEDTQIMADSAPNTRNALQIADVACGDHHVLAVGIDGSLYGWGMNKRGQLGLGGTETKHSPTLVPSMILSTVYANGLSSAGISPAGDLFTWGSGSKYRLMQQKVEGEDRQGDDSNRYVPAYVETLYGNIVHSFAFSRKGSAALVVTRLYELSPVCGPQKSFKELQIQGCGFWDSDRIIVTFTSVQRECPDPYAVNPNPKPRSAPGRLSAPGVISCKPPRLAESGDYEVTVSLDGVIFVKDSLLLTIYPDVTVSAVTPKLLDRRTLGPTQIKLTLKGFQGPSGAELEEEAEPALYDVKLLFGPLLSSINNSSSSNKGGPSDVPVTEVMVQGRLEVMIVPDLAVAALPQDFNETQVQMVSIVPVEYVLVCDISEALNSVSISNLLSIRACVTMNGLDFSAVSSDVDCMIVCHAFQPLSLSPTSCQCPLEDTGGAAMKEVRVVGESFFPARDMPPNLIVQATLTASRPIGNLQSSGDNESNDSASKHNTEWETVSIVVPVRCTSQREMFFTPPSLQEFTALFSGDSQRALSILKTSVNFQLVSKTETVQKSSGRGGKDTNSSQTGSQRGSQKGESIQSLMPSIGSTGMKSKVLSLVLFNPQPITIDPLVCRRPGGTVLTVRGVPLGGIRCCPYPELVKIQLAVSGVDGDVTLTVPDIIVLKEGEREVISELPAQSVAELGATMESMNFEEEKEDSNSLLSRLFARERKGSSAMDSASADGDPLNVEFKFQFTMPDMSALLFTDLSAARPFDTVSVSLSLDGEAVPSGYSSHLLMFDSIKVLSILNPKGGHGPGSIVTVAMSGVPDIVTNCVVQIRGEDKDKRASGVVATFNKLFVEISGTKSREAPQDFIFTLPAAEVLQKLLPVLVKKAKMYYVDISIDGGSSFDSSTTAILQLAL